jgi:hypothetical protein
VGFSQLTDSKWDFEIVSMVERDVEPHLRRLAKRHPVIAITGPRQSGKTTLCRAVFPKHPYVSLEAPDERRFALDDARGFLARFPDGAILDEVQRAPELLSYLQGLVDEDPRNGRWILTGSQQFALSHAISQSLAGRVALLELLPLSVTELRRFKSAPRGLFETLYTGGYPRIVDRRLPPAEWLASYVATYLERDVREVLRVGDLLSFQTFLTQAAARSAQLLNLSNLGVDAGITQPTAKAWLSVLETGYVAYRVPPFVRNLRRRLVKTPKLYFVDSGLLCHLLGIRSPDELVRHPLRGAVFETWVVSEVRKAFAHRGERAPLTFYRDQTGVEVDLVIEHARELIALEIKSGQTVASDFFANLDRFETELQHEHSKAKLRRVLAFGGDQGQKRSDTRVLAWDEVGAYFAGR